MTSMGLALSEKQVRSLHACQYGTFNVWEGSIRGGKTYVSILAFLVRVASASDDGELVIVGRNLGSIYRNFFRTIETSPGLRAFKGAVSYRQNAQVAWIMGREVQVIGLNDARAESKIRGMTIQIVYVDEITVIREETFKQILNRMSLATSKLFGTTNPDSPAHWFKVEFLDRLKDLPDWRRFHFTMDDNPSLSVEVRQRLASQYTGLWYKRFIQGLWVAAEGAIYDMWDQSRHVVPWGSLPAMGDLFAVGVDFGTNHPSAAILLGRSEETVNGRHASRLYAIDEWRFEGRTASTGTLSPAKQAVMFRGWLEGEHLPYVTTLRPRFVVYDSAAPHFARSLEDVGVRNTTPSLKGPGSVSWGIGRVSSLLSEDKLVVSDRCPGLIREIPSYSWDSTAVMQGRDEPVKVNDDSCDALRYGLTSTENYWQGKLAWRS